MNAVTPEAFYRREPPRDEDGMSVATIAPLDAVKPDGINEMDWFGIATLHVGTVRDIGEGIDIIPDSEKHANITGVPRRSEDEGKAQFFADQLSASARICCVESRMWPKKKK